MTTETIVAFSVSGIIDDLVRRGHGKPFGWKAMDDRDIGADPGDLVIVAGRTGHGKSTVVLNLLAEWLATYPEQVFLIFSNELPKEAILLRMLSILTRRQGTVGWSYHDIQRCLQGSTGTLRIGLNVEELHNAVHTLKGWEKRLVAVYQPDWNVLEVTEFARSVRERTPTLGGVFVDYLQLIDPPPGQYDGHELEVAITARHLKRLAVHIDCPVVAAAQIRGITISATDEIPFGSLDDRRVLEFIAKRRPQLHHLRDAGGEQEADLVLGILNYQADYFAVREEAGLDQTARVESGNAAPFDVAVIKNRHGALGAASLVLEAASGAIRDLGVFGH